MKKITFYQQGDVLIFPVDSIPEGKKVENILAKGETTGHAHRVVEGDAEVYARDGVLYMKASTPVKIGHEEHGAQTIPAGKYRIGIVKEVDPFEKVIRNVRD